MPLTIQPHHSVAPPDRGAASRRDSSNQIVIALVNNMPDSALEATAAQFSRLLRAAAGPLSVQLRFCYLPEVPRSPQALEHLTTACWPVADILRNRVDGLIVTGMEPKAPRLADEPYWSRFQELLAWAESCTISSIWSCLAAHAAVQVLDGIERRRLPEKCCGVFHHSILAAHPMMSGIRAPLATPHSRWNEAPATPLREAGYTIVSSSPESGADLFVKQSRSLLVFFQGHPEYEETTLLKEYRRDIARFLRGEQSHYPSMPRGYLSPEAQAQLASFRDRACARDVPAEHGEASARHAADLLEEFPIDAVSASLQNTWGAAAVRLYRNWLSLIAAAKHPGTVVASTGS